MIYNFKTIILAISTILFFSSCSRKEVKIKNDIDWEKFLSGHDLVWDSLPGAYTEGPFLGNGMLGSMIYKEPNENAIRLEVCRSDVQDHRTKDHGETPFSRGRLPIGFFHLKPNGTILSSTMRLDLWNAEATAEIITDMGKLYFTSYVHTDSMLIVTQVKTTKGEKDFKWKWHGIEAKSPRQLWGIENNQPFRTLKGYKENPKFKIVHKEKISYCLQPLLQGGQTVTAWKEVENDDKRTLFVNVSHSWPEDKAINTAGSIINNQSADCIDFLKESHRKWWHTYYPQSFVSIPDKKIESFYWIQMYKLASATRAHRAYIDNHGPWLEKTAWPYATWNLNVQLTYWPVYASNRLHLGESLLNALWDNRENLRNNLPEQYRENAYGIGRAAGTDCIANVGVPGTEDGEWTKDQSNTPEVGLLTWACHNLWLQYRFTMDKEILKDKIFPLLKGAMNYYLNFLEYGDDGKLHLPKTYCPEFFGSFYDCNFDLALIKWATGALLESAEVLGISDPLIPKWKEVRTNLAEYPEDKNGFMIGANQPYEYSHRHYSHLLMIYPLYDVNIEQKNGSTRIDRSLKFWQSKKELLRGFSSTGASSISASMGDGNRALSYLEELFCEFLRPNTLYVEEGGPCIETPLSGAQNIHDMLMQSWGGKVRIFPAVPDEWDNVCFDNLRAEGAFLVSAKRKNGKTVFVKIKSLEGEPLMISTDFEGIPQFSGARIFNFKQAGKNVYSIDLKKDEEVIIHPHLGHNDFLISPVANTSGQPNYFGSKAILESKVACRIK